MFVRSSRFVYTAVKGAEDGGWIMSNCPCVNTTIQCNNFCQVPAWRYWKLERILRRESRSATNPITIYKSIIIHSGGMFQSTRVFSARLVGMIENGSISRRIICRTHLKRYREIFPEPEPACVMKLNNNTYIRQCTTFAGCWRRSGVFSSRDNVAWKVHLGFVRGEFWCC